LNSRCYQAAASAAKATLRASDDKATPLLHSGTRRFGGATCLNDHWFTLLHVVCPRPWLPAVDPYDRSACTSSPSPRKRLRNSMCCLSSRHVIRTMDWAKPGSTTPAAGKAESATHASTTRQRASSSRQNWASTPAGGGGVAAASPPGRPAEEHLEIGRHPQRFQGIRRQHSATLFGIRGLSDRGIGDALTSSKKRLRAWPDSHRAEAFMIPACPARPSARPNQPLTCVRNIRTVKESSTTWCRARNLATVPRRAPHLPAILPCAALSSNRRFPSSH